MNEPNTDKTEDECIEITGVDPYNLILLDETDNYWVVLHDNDREGQWLNMVFKRDDWSKGEELEMLSSQVNYELLEYPQIAEWLGENAKRLANALRRG